MCIRDRYISRYIHVVGILENAYNRRRPSRSQAPSALKAARSRWLQWRGRRLSPVMNHKSVHLRRLSIGCRARGLPHTCPSRVLSPYLQRSFRRWASQPHTANKHADEQDDQATHNQNECVPPSPAESESSSCAEARRHVTVVVLSGGVPFPSMLTRLRPGFRIAISERYAASPCSNAAHCARQLYC